MGAPEDEDLESRARKYFEVEKGPKRTFTREKVENGEIFSLPNGICVYCGTGEPPNGYQVIDRDEEQGIVILRRKHSVNK